MKRSGTLTHIDSKGEVSMVDVGSKPVTIREAQAQARVVFPTAVMTALWREDDLHTKKGSVTQIARIAGIQAAKKTSELIPLCHALPLDQIKIDIHKHDENTLMITSYVKTSYKTGVEMESLAAVTVAALTIYDMCKALSHDIRIESVCLMHKKGGKKNFKRGSTGA